jgi:hypothetical protein
MAIVELSRRENHLLPYVILTFKDDVTNEEFEVQILKTGVAKVGARLDFDDAMTKAVAKVADVKAGTATKESLLIGKAETTSGTKATPTDPLPPPVEGKT